MLTTILVDSLEDNMLLDGTVTLREAILAANNNISVDGSAVGDGADTIVFDQSLSGHSIVLGGTELDISEALEINASTLAASLSIDAQNSSRVLDIIAPEGDFSFSNLIFTRGQHSTGDGGAIRSRTTGTLTFNDSTISESTALSAFARGGGIFASGDLALTNSLISGNSTSSGIFGSEAHGGGIYVAGRLTMVDSTVTGNQTAKSRSKGGGIHARDQIEMIRSVVSNNSTTGPDSYGGGVYTRVGIELSQSVISGNRTEGGRSHGGGIYARHPVVLSQSTVSENMTSGYWSQGGGIWSRREIMARDSTIDNNSTLGADAAGGGVFTYSRVDLIQSTISGNSTQGTESHGGGIYASGDFAVSHSTIAGNRADGNSSHGGGLYQANVALGRRSMVIRDSIIAGNSATGSTPDVNNDSGGFLFFLYSLIGIAEGLEITGREGSLLGNSDVPLDPRLDPLADNGGLTKSHALRQNSPAIDHGNPEFDFAIGYDQRGFDFARVVGPRLDMGAFENGSSSANFDADRDIDGIDFLLWQRGFGDLSANHSEGDANLDQSIDAADLSIWRSSFGTSLPELSPSLVGQETTNRFSALVALESRKSSTSSEGTSIFLDSPEQVFPYTDDQISRLPLSGYVVDRVLDVSLEFPVKSEPPFDWQDTYFANEANSELLSWLHDDWRGRTLLHRNFPLHTKFYSTKTGVLTTSSRQSRFHAVEKLCVGGRGQIAVGCDKQGTPVQLRDGPAAVTRSLP